MKKVLFINFPVSGHVNPQLDFCKELAEKDVKLIYYTYDKYFPKFKGIDKIELRKYPDDFMDYYNQLESDSRYHKKLLALIYVFYTLTEKVLPFIMEEVKKEKPDLIICDTLAVWGKIAARYYNIPHAFFFCGLMGDSLAISKSPAFQSSLFKAIMFEFPYAMKFSAIERRIKKKYGNVTDKPQNILAHQGKFSIVMTSKEFHPAGNEYPDNVKFIGPSYIEDCPNLDNKHIIFISMGTISFSNTFWDICIEATKNLGYDIVISFGGNNKNIIMQSNLPQNVRLYNNLSLDEYRNVLKQSVLFISHGGFNSITDSILYKTPLLVCPITSEQVGNGALVQDYNCGRYTQGRINLDKLKKLINEILNDRDIPKGLEQYRQSYLKSMGFKKAVEELNKEFNLY